MEAFGKAVPPDTKISRGLDGPPEENAFPEARGSVQQAQGGQVQVQQQVQQVQQQQQQGLGGVQMQGVADGDIAEFMDLDRMEEGPFSQGYGEQGGQF